jgi:RNA polymerase sigma-70 factor (ECF subfamily)
MGDASTDRRPWRSGVVSVRYNPRFVTPSDRHLQPDVADVDLLLMQRLASRDASALADLYDRHSGLLFGLVLRILGQRGEAEEVLQEVFLTAWTRAATYNSALGSPAGWLVGIARNRSVDRLRANAVRTRAIESAALEPIAVDSPEREASISEQQRAVALALDALPREQRELIEQAYFLGLTQSELAERHQLPLGTVKTRIRTGMLALRQHLSHSYIQQ